MGWGGRQTILTSSKDHPLSFECTYHKIQTCIMIYKAFTWSNFWPRNFWHHTNPSPAHHTPNTLAFLVRIVSASEPLSCSSFCLKCVRSPFLYLYCLLFPSLNGIFLEGPVLTNNLFYLLSILFHITLLYLLYKVRVHLPHLNYKIHEQKKHSTYITNMYFPFDLHDSFEGHYCVHNCLQRRN